MCLGLVAADPIRRFFLVSYSIAENSRSAECCATTDKLLTCDTVTVLVGATELNLTFELGGRLSSLHVTICICILHVYSRSV